MTDPGLPSLMFVLLVGSPLLLDGSLVETCCCNNSMRFKAGTSPLQYLRHICLYVDSNPWTNFAPSQRGDLDMSSRRLILKFCSAETSEANFRANFSYSSSFLAIKWPRPELLKDFNGKATSPLQIIPHKKKKHKTDDRKICSITQFISPKDMIIQTTCKLLFLIKKIQQVIVS